MQVETRNSDLPDASDLRRRMVDEQLAARGIRDERVLAAMRRIPRERFVPPWLEESAYDDRALSIGQGQTISQPYIVALMSEMLELRPAHRVLEIGSGSGYQAAILAELAAEVHTVDRLPELSQAAQGRLEGLGYTNIRFHVGDGSAGWPEFAPYDRIIVTAAAPDVPAPLVEQLDPNGGRLVIPVGVDEGQYLTVIVREHGRVIERPGVGVRFVPLIGEYAFRS